MQRYCRLAAVCLFAVPLLLLGQGAADLLRAVNKAAWAKDVATAERLVGEYRKQHPEMTPELLEAICTAFRRRGVQKVRTLLARDDTLVLAFFRSQGMTAAPFIALEREL